MPAENPVDAYRDIKALLERMVNEFQGPKAVQRVEQAQQTSHFPIYRKVQPEPSSHAVGSQVVPAGTKVLQAPREKPKESVTVGHNQVVSPRPAVAKGTTLETVRERLTRWGPDLQLTDGLNEFLIKPTRYNTGRQEESEERHDREHVAESILTLV